MRTALFRGLVGGLLLPVAFSLVGCSSDAARDVTASAEVVADAADASDARAGEAGPEAVSEVDSQGETALEDQPCIQVFPDTIPFGGRPLGGRYVQHLEIRNCSAEATLHVEAIAFSDAVNGCEGSFCVQLPEGTPLVSSASPVILEPDQGFLLDVTYEPATQAATDPATGAPIEESAILLVSSNAFTSVVEIPVSGFGVAYTCPVAVIRVDEGAQVAPQTVLHLHGEDSYSPAGAIHKYQWTVEQPVSSVATFTPTPTFPSPIFEADQVGMYVFRLRVWDEHDHARCFPAEVQVFAVPAQAIRVDVTWTSPGDPNPTDEGPDAGTDLDLHFAHPNASQPDLDGDGAPDPWFDPLWDVFWFYPNQNWGSAATAADNPSMIRDDVATLGPEIVTLAVAEEGKAYAIGVNAWDDHGYGDSYATVRVSVYGSPVYESPEVQLTEHDMWYVGHLEWPSGTFVPKTSAQGGPFVTPDYHHEFFFQP